MREQSHKSEMADALRADFRRLRDRGVESTLGQVVAAPPRTEEPAEEETSEPAAVTRDPSATGSWVSRFRRR